MSNQKNVISLNGKLYDAKTGAVFTQAPNSSHRLKAAKHAKRKTLDGFMITHKPRPAPKELVQPATAVSHKPHQPAKKVAPHQPQKAKTLMRSAVKKPAALQSHAQKPVAAAPEPELPHVTAPATMDAVRLNRAQKVSKSHLISRFGTVSDKGHLVKKSAHMKVRTAPKTEHITGHISAPVSEPTVFTPIAEGAQDIFTEAIGLATSHKQSNGAKTKRRHRVARKLHLSTRAMNVSVSVLMVLALGGFIALQNKPNIEMRLASSKAGLHAGLPSYKPSGFSYKGVQTAPGAVKVSFLSNTDNRSFSILQSTSNWNSETLKDSFVATTNQPYQTREDNGKTVYLYGDSNATWVDGGVWYKVEGNSKLNSDQLLQLANSL